MKTFGQIFCFLILTTLLIGCSDDDNNDLVLTSRISDPEIPQ